MILSLVHILPFVAGLFFLFPPHPFAAAASYLLPLEFFLLLFGAVLLLLRLVTTVHRGRKETRASHPPALRTGWRRLGYFAAVLTLAFLMLAALQALRQRIPPFLFYLAVVMVPLKGLERKFLVDRRFRLHFSASLVFYTGVAYLSLNLREAALARVDVLNTIWIFVSLLSSLALACMVTAAAAAAFLERKPAPPSARGDRIFFALLALLGPSLIGFLGFVRLLPPVYMIVLLCIPLSGRLIAALKLKQRDTPLPAAFARQSSGLCLLFAAMILLSGLLRF